MNTSSYRGRFAPSPTGPLHAGSLVAALASWLDARAHNGTWLVRLEDVDTPRTAAGAAQCILEQLQSCGLVADELVTVQSTRTHLYEQALAELRKKALVYPCTCSRKQIADTLMLQGLNRERHRELVYPGTCRPRLMVEHADLAGAWSPSAPCAWRLRTDVHLENGASGLVEYASTATKSIADRSIQWVDRCSGLHLQDVEEAVGDFVLRRADGCFTYQLAVVVDDASQGITHVVRGSDLADNTARQVLLQRALRLPTPHYLHTPLVLGSNGEKLSKQNGAPALDTSSQAGVRQALASAASVLRLSPGSNQSVSASLQQWVQEWRTRFAGSHPCQDALGSARIPPVD
jgi:glutamyl-Q tRNA(Asp) synthetase